MTYDLSYFYDLKAPGKYVVYIELRDDRAPETSKDADLWVRSPTAEFEIEAPAR